MKPRWSGATFLHYAGAGVTLVATLALIAILTAEADGHRAGIAAGWSALALVVALAVALLLRARHAILAGLAALLALLFLATFVAALVTWIGIEPDDANGFLQRDWEPGLYLVELAIVVGGLALLALFAFPLLVLPVVATLLYAF